MNRIRYYTMNPWNLSKAPAYNLKVYNVIPAKLRDKVYEMMGCENFYSHINDLIKEFDEDNDYEWQAGFNGRSGGYLVLYRGGIKDGRIFSQPGREIEDDEVPDSVMELFDNLAKAIVEITIELAKGTEVVEEVIEIPKKIKLIKVKI